MLRGKLIKKGLAKVMALTLAVSMAMPGTALAAATQPTLDEAAVDIYEEEGTEEATAAEESAEEAAVAEESAEQAPALTNTAADEADKETEGLTEEGSEAENPAEEAPTEEAPEVENPAAAPEDEGSPADLENEAAPAAPEDDGTPAGTEEDSAANEEPADMETDISAPAAQEYSAAPAAASPKMNKVTSITLLGSIRTVFLGLTGRKTFQMDVEVTYDTSTSYETNEPVFYKSTDESVVTVDSNGKVTAVGTGYAYVQVYTKTETTQYFWTSRGFSVSEAAYAVNFDLNGGTLAEELKGSAADMYYMYKYGTGVSSGKSVTLQTNIWNGTETVYIVKRDGYVFDGWTETKDGEDIVDTYYYP